MLLEGHDGYVDIAGWSPTEDVIVTASSDKSVRTEYPGYRVLRTDYPDTDN